MLYVHDAAELKDLRVPPGNRLEALRGGRKGYHSIRISDQWRLAFRWQGGNAFEVEIVDYHLVEVFRLKQPVNPFHPGEILLEEFLQPVGMTQVALAEKLGPVHV